VLQARSASTLTDPSRTTWAPSPKHEAAAPGAGTGRKLGAPALRGRQRTPFIETGLGATGVVDPAKSRISKRRRRSAGRRSLRLDPAHPLPPGWPIGPPKPAGTPATSCEGAAVGPRHDACRRVTPGRRAAASAAAASHWLQRADQENRSAAGLSQRKRCSGWSLGHPPRSRSRAPQVFCCCRATPPPAGGWSARGCQQQAACSRGQRLFGDRIHGQVDHPSAQRWPQQAALGPAAPSGEDSA